MFKSTHSRHLLLIGILSAWLVVMRWHDMGLPSYWDEAYPYAEAIRWQYNHSVSILPGSIPPDLSTGHPLLYYTAQSGWMRLTGGGMFGARILPMLMAVAMLFATYRFGRRHLTAAAGLTGALLLATRSVFFVQSTFMLPEIMLSLFILLAIDAWLRKRWVWYFVCAGLAMLTKESGMMLPVVMGLAAVWRGFKEEKIAGVLKQGIYTSLPVLVPALFFFIQKQTYGWYFFPRHLDSMGFEMERFVNNFLNFFRDLTRWKGATVGTVILLVSAGVLIWQRKKVSNAQWGSIALLALFFVLMWAYASVSVYAGKRYIMCVYPMLFLIMGFVVITAWEWMWKYTGVFLLFIASGFQLYATMNREEFGDCAIGYADRVRLMQVAFRWYLENGYQHEPILANYTPNNNMFFEGPGYLTRDQLFDKATNFGKAKVRFAMDTDFDPLYEEVKAMPKKRRVRFEMGTGWIDIYEMQPPIDSVPSVVLPDSLH